MNCQRFEELVDDIAREQILDAGVRSEALAHSSECEHCTLRLEDEFALTVRLRNFAAGFESIGAPAGVETQLLAAFTSHPPVGSQQPSMSRKPYWTAAIAAMLLLVFALSIFRPRQSAPAAEKTNVAQAGSPTIPVVSPLVASTDRHEPPQLSAPRPRTLAARQNRRRATPKVNQSKPRAPTEPIGNIEIATDFLPVTYGGVANLADGGRMVRVQLPRSAMASFGLPVNMDRANEWVKADVLVGVDGLAHAIRFVR